jgi:hypothetical protein
MATTNPGAGFPGRRCPPVSAVSEPRFTVSALSPFWNIGIGRSVPNRNMVVPCVEINQGIELKWNL